MSAAICGIMGGVIPAPGFRCAHPGYLLLAHSALAEAAREFPPRVGSRDGNDIEIEPLVGIVVRQERDLAQELPGGAFRLEDGGMMAKIQVVPAPSW
jgi:hypothetical protein